MEKPQVSSKNMSWILSMALAAGFPLAAAAQDTGDQPEAPPAQPAAAGQPGGAEQPEPEIMLLESSEPIEFQTLVEYVAEALNITITASDELQGSFVLNAPQSVRRDQLLPFLDSLLATKGYTIVQDRPGFYQIIKVEDVSARPIPEDGPTTTRIIPTPTLRPSSLQELINNQLGAQNRQLRISYLDELGIIVATETPRRMATLVNLVDRVLGRAAEQTFIRFELEHVAASVARRRVLDLIGQQQIDPMSPQALQPIVAGGGVTPGTMTNLADRLTIDPQGNALILRGFESEAARIQQILTVLDKANTLEYRQYHAGMAAAEIAQFAARIGLGGVEMIDTGAVQGGLTQPAGARANQPANFQQQGFQQFQQGGEKQIGGPVLVVDESRGTITYYGTQSQQAQLAAIIQAFDVGRDALVIETYKLRNSPAMAVAEVIQAILTNETPTETGSGFLPGSERSSRRSGRGGLLGGLEEEGGLTGEMGGRRQREGGQEQEGEGITSFGIDEIFVVADRANNQLLVKAPARQQSEFAKLIMRLDQRRPQVYINVQIVAVSDTDDFRLAVETQLINSDGTGGALNTNFGLGTFQGVGTGPNAPTSFVSPKLVNTTLGGITAAIINSSQVPIIINALKQETDARILSSPQLLVDDNEEAYIASIEQQPTSTAVTGTATTNTTFGGYEDAGTELTVTPSISEAGYMRLSYEILLSNFRGQGIVVGDTRLPPVKEKRTVSSDSVTIPDGATIVVGGIKVDSRTNTVLKVPLLGDIPILGHLFRDTNINSANTRLYVFITPTILRDATFRDLILLSKGPQSEADIQPDMPDLQPVMIEMGERPAPPVLPEHPRSLEPDPLDSPLPGRTPELPPEPARTRENPPEPELPPVPMQ